MTQNFFSIDHQAALSFMQGLIVLILILCLFMKKRRNQSFFDDSQTKIFSFRTFYREGKIGEFSYGTFQRGWRRLGSTIGL